MAQCSANSKRSKEQCLRWAVRGSNTCHMHGGRSKGPRTTLGRERSRLAVLKHGRYTKETKAKHCEVLELIKNSRTTLGFF